MLENEKEDCTPVVPRCPGAVQDDPRRDFDQSWSRFCKVCNNLELNFWWFRPIVSLFGFQALCPGRPMVCWDVLSFPETHCWSILVMMLGMTFGDAPSRDFSCLDLCMNTLWPMQGSPASLEGFILDILMGTKHTVRWSWGLYTSRPKVPQHCKILIT